MSVTKQYKLKELVHDLDVTIKGDPDCLISGVCPIQQSKSGHITFLTNSLYRKYLPTTNAAVVILKEEDASECQTNAIITNNPHYIYAKVAEFFATKPNYTAGIHSSVVIGKNCQIASSTFIAPHCVIGDNVVIGENVVIGSNSVINNDVSVGEESHIDPRVTIYHHVKIGKRCRIASGAVIGSEGFGFANNKGAWHKVAQLGGVEIGDDVDIGANTSIDRGAVENTVIGNGVKIDNLIQIGHNVQIGDHTIIAGCVGIAGSTVIGKHCMVGGATSITGHITIADKVMITGGTNVTKSIKEPGLYSSGLMGLVTNEEFRKNSARFNRLESLMSRVKALEAVITERKEQ